MIKTSAKACLALMLFSVLVGCKLGSTGSAQPSPTPLPLVKPVKDISPTPYRTPSPTDLRISGYLTYDYVPHVNTGGGLDYSAMSAEPIRGAVVQLFDANSNLAAITESDENGFYELNAEPNTAYFVRVRAELWRTAKPTWLFQVTDNTDNNSLYALDGALRNSGTADSQRDLHASSGWDGTTYSGVRAAAPFAILDSVYQMLMALSESGLNNDLPPTELRWSPDNKANQGETENGDIGTSHFNPALDAIYLLGFANNDSDEYDRTVVQHELVHMLESAMSRTESIGGTHSLADLLDMRVAFGEGWANALAAYVSGGGIFRDSSGSAQQSGFSFDLNRAYAHPGWYSEASIGNLVFDLLDSDVEAGDNLALGLAPLIAAQTSAAYKNSPALTSVYSFSHSLRAVLSAQDALYLDEMMDSLRIFGRGIYGEGETNSASSTVVLPIYHQVDIGQEAVLCSRAAGQKFNNYIEVRRFLRVTVPSERRYTLSALTTEQTTGDKDPDMVIYKNGQVVKWLNETHANTESASLLLKQGEHIIEVYDYGNVDADDDSKRGTACFTVSLTEA